MLEIRTTPCVCRLQVYELTLRYTQHQDHNVVTGALELLQQLFRTPPPELLQALTTAGGLAQLPATRDQPGGRGRSGSIVELIGESLGRPTPNEPCSDAGCPLSDNGQPGCVRHCAPPLLKTKLIRQESSRPTDGGTGVWKARRQNEVGSLRLGCLHVAFCLSRNENVRGGISRTCYLCYCARGGILKSSGAFRVPFCPKVPPHCPDSLGDPPLLPTAPLRSGLRPGPAPCCCIPTTGAPRPAGPVWRGETPRAPDEMGALNRSLWDCVWQGGGSCTAWPLLGPVAWGRFSAASVWRGLYSELPQPSRTSINLSNCCFI